MSEQVTLRVRPGFTHGAHKQFREGDLLVVDTETAGQLLAAFGDKLEDVSSATFQVSSDATAPAVEPEPDVTTDDDGPQTAEAAPEEGRPGGRRSQRSRRSA